jgi:hypothetical protein
MDDYSVIHYIKPDEIYGIYGTITLIFLVLLIWYFVRSNMYNNVEGMFPIENPKILEMMPEWNGAMTPVPHVPSGRKLSNHYCGNYGGVPACIYDVSNGIYKPEWDHNTTMFLPNTRTLFRQALDESIVWD